jgi:hypothetical protein
MPIALEEIASRRKLLRMTATAAIGPQNPSIKAAKSSNFKLRSKGIAQFAQLYPAA